MHSDQVPTWMVILIALFGLCTGLGAITFQHFYADGLAVQEERRIINSKLPDRRQLLAEIRGHIEPLNDQLGRRQNQILALDERDSEAQDRISVGLGQRLNRNLETVRTSIDNLDEQRTDLDGQADRALNDLEQEERQFVARQRENEAALRRTRQDIEAQSQAIEVQRRGHRAELAGIQSRIEERERRVQELLNRIDTRADELQSDGIILQARVTDGFAFINRGLDHNLRQGTRFVIFNRRGGQNYIKGELEVVRVYPGMSECRILDERDANDPIVPGDHIHNNIYFPDRQLVFVISGDFDLYTNAELRRFIEQTGSRVDRSITSETSYLVAGRNAAAALETARINGVTVMSERQLLEFVRRPDSFRFSSGLHYVIAGDFTEVDAGTIRRFLEGHGGIIQSRIDTNTEVLIAGENAADEIGQARAGGAMIFDQRQFLHLMAQDGGR